MSGLELVYMKVYDCPLLYSSAHLLPSKKVQLMGLKNSPNIESKISKPSDSI